MDVGNADGGGGHNMWSIEKITKNSVHKPLVEESSFAILFPRYRETYFKEVQGHLCQLLSKHGIKCELDFVNGYVIVKTTEKTFDPYIIIKARDLVKLVARSVPLLNAAKVLEDGICCDIMKISSLVRKKERFIKRRFRLVGPNGNTLKAIELLTKCSILVQGHTVSIIGPHEGIKETRKIVEATMNNIHPVYCIKELMIKKELQKDEKLKNESWDRFLPKYKKRHTKKKKPTITKKEASSPFPQPAKPRKIDLEMETGEYFLKLKKEKRSSGKKAKNEKSSSDNL